MKGEARQGLQERDDRARVFRTQTEAEAYQDLSLVLRRESRALFGEAIFATYAWHR